MRFHRAVFLLCINVIFRFRSNGFFEIKVSGFFVSVCRKCKLKVNFSVNRFLCARKRAIKFRARVIDKICPVHFIIKGQHSYFRQRTVCSGGIFDFVCNTFTAVCNGKHRGIANRGIGNSGNGYFFKDRHQIAFQYVANRCLRIFVRNNVAFFVHFIIHAFFTIAKIKQQTIRFVPKRC